MYRLATAVLHLGVFRDTPITCISVHILGVGRSVSGASWLLFIVNTPIRTGGRGPWLGYLVECRLVSGRGQLMHSAPY